MKEQIMTLRELRTKIGSTKGIENPVKRQLMETGVPVDSYQTGDYRITVFENGFALAQSGKRWTVVRADECTDYTYFYTDSTLADEEFTHPQHITEDAVLDQPWPIRIMLTADDQLEANQNSRERSWLNEHEGIADDKNWMLGSYSSFEGAVIARIDRERWLETLTAKQKEVYRLYYEQGYTLQEIGERLGIGRTSVRERLEGAVRKLSKQL